MKKALPLKALFTFVIMLFALQVNAQLSENFDGPNLSSGQLACWQAYQGSSNNQPIFPGPNAGGPIANNPSFSLNTTTPIAGSGSLQINGSVVPSGANGGTVYTAYVPATSVIGNSATFNFRVNSFVQPNQNYTLAVLLVGGPTTVQTVISQSDIGITKIVTNEYDEFSDPGDLRIIVLLTYVNGETFTEPASFSIDFDNYTTDAAINSDCNPLPVKLARFSAKKSGSQARLDWTTTMEENSEGFAIERSADARKWETVGFVKSKRSNTTDVTDYAWVDENPFSTYNYYRLKQTDLDGSTELSRIVAVNFGKQDLSILYPDPATNRLFISEPASSIQIIDRKGLVVSQSASSPEEGIDVQTLATGLYFIKFQKPDGKTQSQKFIKQ